MTPIIAKFGGTSVKNFESICGCLNIVRNEPQTRVVVVSAQSGVTNLLVSLAHDPLTSEQRTKVLNDIKAIELPIAKQLEQPEEALDKLDQLFIQLADISAHEELNFRDDLKDELLSFGERMSSLLVTEIANEMGLTALNFDARKVIKTDSRFTSAKPDLVMIKTQCEKVLVPEIQGNVIITQGFIGSDSTMRTTTLGRGGSDFTAALLAEGLGAKICQIWTDVAGVYTTDPRLTEDARPLKELSFEEAAEMATFGAKVLHPATMEPALRNDIHVFVGSSKAPELGGTWIKRQCEVEPNYRAITRRRDQILVTVKTPKMLFAQGFLENVFAIVAKHSISVDLVTTSEISVSFTLDNPPNSINQTLNQSTLTELRELCEVSVEEGYDLITVVGNNMHGEAGAPTAIFNAVTDVNLRLICFGANPHNLSFLVAAESSPSVVKKLHKALFN